MHSTSAMSSAIAFCAYVVVCAVELFAVFLLLSVSPACILREQVLRGKPAQPQKRDSERHAAGGRADSLRNKASGEGALAE